MSENLNFGDSNKLPPQNIEAEEAILGGILLDPDAISRVSDRLVPEAFYISAHKDIYQAAVRLHAQDKPTDLLSVTSWLTDRDLLFRIGGRNKLATLVDRTVSAVNIDALAVLVMEKYLRRELIKAGNEIVHLAHDQEEEIAKQLETAESKILEINNSAIASTSQPIHLSDILINAYSSIEEKSMGISPPGVKTGFYDLDAMIGGFKTGKLITIAGRPAMGKSSFLGNLAFNISSLEKLPTVIFSLEMTKEEWGDRFLSQDARIDSSYLQQGKIIKHQWEPLAQSIGRLSELPIYIDDSPVITVNSIRSKVKRIVAEYGHIGMVGIDYLQLMEGTDGDSYNLAFQIGKITRQLKQLARECNTTIVMLSQLNRGVESRTIKRPMMSDLRESGRIEEDSDLILLLYRDEYYYPDTIDRGIAEVIIAKNRGGPTGTTKLLFDAQFTQFKNLAR
ncbi:DnaB helicase (plasmid) [Trichormus variabilis ATCC 29413]|uniref:Replicative DNA helicase n=2 Tax=Anabaena variabilis TaxID=264691 RepID=Q3M1Q0_TRIV2|nr:MULTISPECIES: replicative DNA helicase [Nostocaceae]ABA25086.1 DnaB helicase [Trichormus variabilis ATCC 29413]MBC1218116.1 replicative DNA helicase [Trichormus variabilis ARAD]MBC1259388.1 replicative DNA helicase [Trichormus variabilis V5]MBC1270897.1 replicative DNA helicase [Trichormus variabilis FSR]MBC1305810.1 replicative DNA helicase [Trichormus variabilis N2B]